MDEYILNRQKKEATEVLDHTTSKREQNIYHEEFLIYERFNLN